MYLHWMDFCMFEMNGFLFGLVGFFVFAMGEFQGVWNG